MEFPEQKKDGRNQSQLRFNSDGTIDLPKSIEKDIKLQKKKEELLDIWDNEGYDEEIYHEEDNVSGFNLYDSGDRKPALKFSNNLTQEDVVDKVVNLVNKGKKVIFVRGVCGSGKCLDGNTQIFCKLDGEEFFNYCKISEMIGKKGKILTLNKEGKIIEGNFKNVRKTGIKKLYKLKTRTGREIIASSNHPFLTITGDGIKWEVLNELNNDSYICLPNKINVEGEFSMDVNEIKLLAHLIAEGKLGDKAGSPRYYQCKNQNPVIRQDFLSALRNKFPDGEIIEKGKFEISIAFRDMDTTKGTTNKLRLFIRKYGLDGKKSSNKFIPKEIFNLNKENLAIFLSRLFSCDGCIYINNNQVTVEYYTISERLARNISMLLLRFGIQHTIKTKKFRDNEDYSWRISISNAKNLKIFIEEIGFIGRKQKRALEILPKLKEHKFTNLDKVPRIIREYIKKKGYSYLELDRFLNYEEIMSNRNNKNFRQIREDRNVKTPFVFNQQKIDFLRSHIREVNKHIKDLTISFICSEDLLWDKIISIDYFKEDETYDLEVPTHHNFIANGMIVHNSAMALNIAKVLGNASIIVPGKVLQKQYQEDYSKSKYVLKDNHKKLKIKVITGRENHRCMFKKGASANDDELPCKIEIKERNMAKIQEYLRENPKVRNNLELKDVRRMSIAPVCPYWSPIIPTHADLNLEAKKINYQGIQRISYTIYNRKPGCSYYDQFNAYKEAQVIVFNSAKYKLEFLMNRKPATKVEIIDECDEFLDSFSNSKIINLQRLNNSLISFFSEDEKFNLAIKKIHEIITDLLRKGESEDIFDLRDTPIYELFNIFLENSALIDEIDEDSYIYNVFETMLDFKDFFDESYVRFRKEERGLMVDVVSINLAKKFKELRDKNNALVLMSGTIHNESALRDVFGIEDYEVVDAEILNQGTIEIRRMGFERDCSYRNFQQGNINRERYLKNLNAIVENSVKPALVHVNAFDDLPNEDEKYSLGLNSLITKNKLKEMQGNGNKQIERFKQKEIPVLFTTRCNRGVDFPGEQCKSIIFTKYPNPSAYDIFWNILKRVHPEHFWSFYKDKASREFLQKIYRGVRSKEDHVYLLSPDSRVLDAGEKLILEKNRLSKTD